MAKHLIVISEDALVYDDLAYLKTLPAFAGIWDRVALVERIRAVYPTVTYPEHTSIRTGVYAGRHGIINNERTILTQTASPWEWFNDAVKVPDIFDAAKKAGLTTAAVFWPVTGNHRGIDYLIDEYWPQTPGESACDCFAASGSSPEVIEKIVRPNSHLIEGKHRVHPYCDNFIHACACDIIRQFRPNLLMIHPANVDAYRHQTGLFSAKVTHGLHEVDGWFQGILKAVEDAGMAEDTNIFVISDHGQLNITRIVALNAVLREQGLIDVDDRGEVTDYTAMIKSTALSAQVYLKNAQDAAALARTHQVLNRLCEDGVYGISRVYTAAEAREEEGLYGEFSFVLESDGFTSFSNDWNRPFVRNLDTGDYRFGRATHGHHPDKGPQPTLIAFGPDIKPGARVQRRSIVDEAPTFARVLGIEMPDIDGRAIEEILMEPSLHGQKGSAR